MGGIASSHFAYFPLASWLEFSCEPATLTSSIFVTAATTPGGPVPDGRGNFPLKIVLDSGLSGKEAAGTTDQEAACRTDQDQTDTLLHRNSDESAKTSVVCAV